MGEYRDPEYGWGGLATRLETHEVPGNHIDMFLEPNVEILAAKLRACLLAAQDKNKKSMSAFAHGD
jgi:thioesterase domain-containing protein